MNTDSDSGELPSVGDVIDGRYRVDAVHAVGGMGTVFRATHLLLARPVALKVVSASVVSLPGVAARFLREARMATQLESDHIVEVFDVGVLEGGTPYLVMEWLEGRDLAQVVQKSAPLPVEIAVDYLLQACEALAEVHGRGIIHRDLKPSNLFLVKMADGTARIKLLDFGVSKIGCGDANAIRITQAGTVIGSPSYMSPEQMGEAETADERTDVWGLGVVLFELLTHAVPFGGGALADILGAILLQPLTKASSLVSSVPPGLDDVIARCLKVEPKERFSDVAALSVALAPFGPKNAFERARAITEIRRNARLRPMNARVAARDDELQSVVRSKSDPARVRESARVPESVEPLIKSARLHAMSTDGSNALTVDHEARRMPSRWRATLIAAAVFVIAIGVPLGATRFAGGAHWLLNASVAPPVAEPDGLNASIALAPTLIAPSAMAPTVTQAAIVTPTVASFAAANSPVFAEPRATAPLEGDLVVVPVVHASTAHVANLPRAQTTVSRKTATPDADDDSPPASTSSTASTRAPTSAPAPAQSDALFQERQ